MRALLATLCVVSVVSACHGADDTRATDAAPAADAPRTYPFGPFTINANEEVTTDCVQITLHNETTLFVNQIELTTGAGFHHSNWFFVPASDDTTGVIGPFDGPDGTFTCGDRHFDQVVAGLKGGVIFAQSTQSAHDVQSFPAGAVVQVPPHSKLVAQIHLLNASDARLTLAPSITLTPILESNVTIKLSGVSFEDHALGLPPNHRSKFSVDCDLQPQWNTLLANGSVTAPTPDFKLYYALAHYHVLGTGMNIDALAADATSSKTVFETTSQVGDALGGTIDPPISMAGYSHLRFSCDYYNNTSATVGWGNGSQEMCVFLAFSDSAYNWAGGALNSDPPGPATMDGDVMTYSHACQVFAVEQSTH